MIGQHAQRVLSDCGTPPKEFDELTTREQEVFRLVSRTHSAAFDQADKEPVSA